MCPLRAGIFLNRLWQILHSTGFGSLQENKKKLACRVQKNNCCQDFQTPKQHTT